MNRIPASISSRSCLQQPDDLRRDGHVERLGDVVGRSGSPARRPARRRSSPAAACRPSTGTGTRRSGAPADGIWTRSSKATTRFLASAPADLRPDGAQLLRDLHPDRDGRVERAAGVGADIADVPAAQGAAARHRAWRTGRGHGTAPDRRCARAAAGSSRPAALASTVLPEPLSPIDAQHLPVGDGEADIAQDRPALAAALQLDRQVLDLEQRCRRHQIVPRRACCAPAPARRPSD